MQAAIKAAEPQKRTYDLLPDFLAALVIAAGIRSRAEWDRVWQPALWLAIALAPIALINFVLHARWLDLGNSTNAIGWVMWVGTQLMEFALLVAIFRGALHANRVTGSLTVLCMGFGVVGLDAVVRLFFLARHLEVLPSIGRSGAFITLLGQLLIVAYFVVCARKLD